MTLRQFFDIRMLFLLFSLAALAFIMMSVAPKETLDARLYYTWDQATAYLRSLSAAELHNYLTIEYLDLFFIYKYTRTLHLSLQRVLPAFTMAAFAPALFDVIETSNVILALHKGKPELILSFLGAITFLKWALGAVVTAAIFYQLFKLRFK